MTPAGHPSSDFHPAQTNYPLQAVSVKRPANKTACPPTRARFRSLCSHSVQTRTPTAGESSCLTESDSDGQQQASLAGHVTNRQSELTEEADAALISPKLSPFALTGFVRLRRVFSLTPGGLRAPFVRLYNKVSCSRMPAARCPQKCVVL